MVGGQQGAITEAKTQTHLARREVQVSSEAETELDRFQGFRNFVSWRQENRMRGADGGKQRSLVRVKLLAKRCCWRVWFLSWWSDEHLLEETLQNQAGDKSANIKSIWTVKSSFHWLHFFLSCFYLKFVWHGAEGFLLRNSAMNGSCGEAIAYLSKVNSLIRT